MTVLDSLALLLVVLVAAGLSVLAGRLLLLLVWGADR